jgi:hypothetical protein
MFQMDIVKVDRDIAYVAMLYTYVANHLFHMFFRRKLQVCFI